MDSPFFLDFWDPGVLQRSGCRDLKRGGLCVVGAAIRARRRALRAWGLMMLVRVTTLYVSELPAKSQKLSRIPIAFQASIHDAFFCSSASRLESSVF